MFRFLDQLTPDHVEAITAYAQMEMLEAGYATNAEFHYLHHAQGGHAYTCLSEMAERVVAAADVSGIGLDAAARSLRTWRLRWAPAGGGPSPLWQ